MSHMLTRREYLFSGEGPTLGANRKTIGYEVLGLVGVLPLRTCARSKSNGVLGNRR